jgi:hypothetical protein
MLESTAIFINLRCIYHVLTFKGGLDANSDVAARGSKMSCFKDFRHSQLLAASIRRFTTASYLIIVLMHS